MPNQIPSSQMRRRVFPYTFKTVGVVAQSISGIAITTNGTTMGLEIINPLTFYSCEGLYFHLRFTNDGLNPGRNIKQIVVQDDPLVPTYKKTLPVNIAPSGLITDISMDISSIRNKTGRNILFLYFDGLASGTANVFKLDMLYQTTGVR